MFQPFSQASRPVISSIFANRASKLCLAGLLLSSASFAGDLQVNTYTTSTQSLSDIAVHPSGSFVVVWQSAGSFEGDVDASSIQGQRYNAGGNPVGAQFQINDITTGDQRGAAVAVAPDGEFIVVWQSESSAGDDTDGHSIQGRRYGADGNPIGGQFQVNTHTTADQLAPDVTYTSDGFVAVWHGYSSSDNDDQLQSVQARMFQADASPIGNDFQVNHLINSSQAFPSVAAGADGEFVVVWQSIGSSGGDTSNYSVQGQRFAANGLSVNDQFQVNTHTQFFQGAPRVASDQNGNFVVVWHGYTALEQNTGVVGRRFTADGTPLSGEFLAATYTELGQTYPAIAMEPDGDGVIVWHSQGSPGNDNSNTSVHARRFTSRGTLLGDQVQVNSYTTSNQFYPAVGISPTGSFVVTWTSQGSLGTDNDAQSVQLSPIFGLLFGDGFETGDTGRWTETP